MAFRLLVIGKTPPATKEIASWLVSNKNEYDFFEQEYTIQYQKITLRVFPFWANKKESRPIGEGVLFVCKAAEELKRIESMMDTYSKMPIKYILYDGIPQQSEFEAKWSVTPITKGESKDFIQQLLISINEIDKRISDVFSKIDVNQSGSIGSSEIENVVKGLGSEMSKEEADSIMKFSDYDTITRDEFIEWWRTGRRSEALIMQKVTKEVYDRTMYEDEMFDEIRKLMEDENIKTRTTQTNFEVILNEGTKDGLRINISLMARGELLDSLIKAYSSAIDIYPKEFFVGIGFGSKDIKVAGNHLKSIVNAITIMGAAFNKMFAETMHNIDIKYGQGEDKAFCCICPSTKGSSIITGLLAKLIHFTNAVKANQFIDIILAFDMNLDKLANDPRALYDLMLDGFTLKVKADVTNKLQMSIYKKGERYLRWMETYPLFTEFRSYIMPFLGLWSGKIEGELKLEANEELKKEIRSNLRRHPVSIPLRDIKMIFKSQIKELLASIPIVQNLINFLKDDVNNVEVFASLGGSLGLKVNINLPGLDSLLSF